MASIINNEQSKSVTTELEEHSITQWFIEQVKFTPRCFIAIIILGLSTTLMIFHLYAGFFGQPEAYLYRSFHFSIVMILIFFFFPLGRKSWNDSFQWTFLVDLLLIILVLFSEIYFLRDPEQFHLRILYPGWMDIIMGTLVLFLVLEATRRTVGWTMVILAIFFIIHALYADRFFSLLYAPPTSYIEMIKHIYMGDGGIYGIPLGVITSFVVLFLIFGQMMVHSGAGRFFINIAYSLTGTYVGGPAKAAVVSSAAFGTISGSTASDVMATGTFTIPLMKRLGYETNFAAAIEAVASTGAAFMPPIMGAVAFVMAAFLGVDYFQVAIRATIPAILYYFSLYLMIHFRAKKIGLRAIPREELPGLIEVLRWGWYLLIPLVALVATLIIGYTASLAASVGIVLIFCFSMLKEETRLTPVKLISTFEKSARAVLPVAAACATAGIIIAATILSGVGLKVGHAVIDLAGGALWLALLLTMLISIILGMGLTTVAVYITLVVTIIPIIAKFIDPFVAHFFALYYGVMSNIIPPVALAAYAASSIAASNPWNTAWTAFFIGSAGMIIPFTFVYRPELLLFGSVYGIIQTVLIVGVAILALASCIQGWMIRKLSLIERIILALAIYLLLDPRFWTTTAGLALVALTIVTQILINPSKGKGEFK